MLIAIMSALWLGVLTSISPCPLAANIAAVSYISMRGEKKGIVLLHGVFYLLGRSLIYSLLGMLIVGAMINMPAVSRFLQGTFNKFLGIILIVVGMFLLELFKLRISLPKPSNQVARKLFDSGIWGALLMGMLFALAFCPVSAALFFGSLIPIALENQSPFLLPVIYGLGTGAPVLVFALVIAFSVGLLSKLMNAVKHVDFWSRRITGVVFILVGIYYALTYVYEVI